jgi:guanosine-3',5'-bis(diphosphate) 3'-pyrophosphohydrolase
MIQIQSHYQEAIKFATYRHMEKNQKVKGTDLPYVVHLSNVAMEILIAALHTHDLKLDFAVQVALLHDTIEDTATTFEELEKHFGSDVAIGVLALTKNEGLYKEEQTADSLVRIKKLQKEVWAVKLADRITNLQPPPSDWSKEKILHYQLEARLILHELKEGNNYLALRLKDKIDHYGGYFQ